MGREASGKCATFENERRAPFPIIRLDRKLSSPTLLRRVTLSIESWRIPCAARFGTLRPHPSPHLALMTLTDYEVQRQRRIEENKRRMLQIGLDKVGTDSDMPALPVSRHLDAEGG
jgi:hypothetical protein